MKVIPVILCGGSGTRLWPLSRENYPKQLLSLSNDHSLLQNTALRCAGHPDITSPILVCNEAHRFLVAEQLRAARTEPRQIILEPEGRNTAPAVALAAHEAIKAWDDAILVVLPSDHVIRETGIFLDALTRAIEHAKNNVLVAFGVVPDRPATCYGYIQKGESVDGGYRVSRFIEKPAEEQAIECSESGLYYWNSGMFVFKASVYLSELGKHRPDIAGAMKEACAKVTQDFDFTRVDEAAFRSSPADSIDYAVMEHTHEAVVVPLDAGWSDIGSWDALWETSEKDEHNNTLVGDVVVNGVENSYIRSEKRLVSVIGLKDIILIETPDAVMAASRERVQEVRTVVDWLEANDRRERSSHHRVYRPWGHYENLDAGACYQVKRISVNPGASLSLQLHRHRAEHWIVVRGTATVTRGDEVFQLKKNESTDIPVETRHRLQNETTEMLEIVEVQSGDYLGEDDIVRFEDAYGR